MNQVRNISSVFDIIKQDQDIYSQSIATSTDIYTNIIDKDIQTMDIDSTTNSMITSSQYQYSQWGYGYTIPVADEIDSIFSFTVDNDDIITIDGDIDYDVDYSVGNDQSIDYDIDCDIDDNTDDIIDYGISFDIDIDYDIDSSEVDYDINLIYDIDIDYSNDYDYVDFQSMFSGFGFDNMDIDR